MIDQNEKSQQELTPAERRLLEQGIKQDQSRSLQEGVPDGRNAAQPAVERRYPQWPTSKPGPRKTTPPAGMQSLSALRPEQVAEIGESDTQDPQRSMPGDELKGRTGFEQLETPQDLPKKRKPRL